MSRLRMVAVGAAALLALTLGVVQWPAGVALAVVLGLLLLAGRFLGKDELGAPLQAFMVGALVVRVVLAVGLQWGAPLANQVPALVPDQRLTNDSRHMGFTLFWDEWKFESVAWGVAEYWTTTPIPPANGQWQLLLPAEHLREARRAFGIQPKFASQYLVPHVYTTAGLYAVVGRDPLAARILQAGVGALAVGLIVLLAHAWVGRRSALLAGGIATVEPSLVFWSPWLLKDVVVVALVGAVLLAALHVVKRPTPLNLLALGGGFLALVAERGPIAITLGLLLPLAAVSTVRPWRTTAAAALGLLLLSGTLLWVGGRGFLGSGTVNLDLPAELLSFRAKVAADNATTQFPTGDPAIDEAVKRAPGSGNAVATTEDESFGTSVRRNLAVLPVSLAYVLGAPFAWELRSTRDALALLAMPLWYGLLGLAALGTWLAWGERKRQLLLPVVFFAATILYLSLTETSVGNIVRHRVILLPMLLPLACHATLALAARVRARQAVPTSGTLAPSPSTW